MKRVVASMMFFTRLPLWRVCSVPNEYFKRVVELWPLVGWITGAVMAMIFWLCSLIFPIPLSIIIALLSRLLLTGALHEDGLADFCDGFGAGGTREHILSIMKDSHIGTYGVLGLIFYYLIIWNCMVAVSVAILPFVMIAADAWSKCCAAQIINFLPYCRTSEQAKNKTIYQRMGIGATILCIIFGAIPLLLIPVNYYFGCIASVLTSFLLIILMKQKIGGYTGDCCGASFLLSELAFYLTITCINSINCPSTLSFLN